MTLIPDPGRAAKPVLISRFVRSGIGGNLHSLALRLGLKRLEDIVPDDWKIPDSDLACRAVQTVEALCPGFIVRHSYRTYCFGAMLAARNGMKLDEVPPLSLASILEAHPRDGFKACFSPCLQHQADTKPHSSIAGAMALGLSDMIREKLDAA